MEIAERPSAVRARKVQTAVDPKPQLLPALTDLVYFSNRHKKKFSAGFRSYATKRYDATHRRQELQLLLNILQKVESRADC